MCLVIDAADGGVNPAYRPTEEDEEEKRPARSGDRDRDADVPDSNWTLNSEDMNTSAFFPGVSHSDGTRTFFLQSCVVAL